jgi:hypothetical protein
LRVGREGSKFRELKILFINSSDDILTSNHLRAVKTGATELRHTVRSIGKIWKESSSGRLSFYLIQKFFHLRASTF